MQQHTFNMNIYTVSSA